MKKLLHLLLLFPLIGLSQTITLADADILAFPTAVGHGKNATGGRGGAIYEVTNLNTSGSGSLQYGLDDTATQGDRTIIFKVGGEIVYSGTATQLTTPNVTIAGQTAPGGGISIRGLELQPRDNNIIIRHIRMRGVTGGSIDNLRIRAVSTQLTDIIFDHVSLGFGTDENISSTNAKRVTIMNSIFSDSQGTGAFLFQEPNDSTTVYQNAWVWNTHRNPRSSTSDTNYELINNYWYGHEVGLLASYENEVDVIGNHWDNETDATTQTIRLGDNNTADGNIALTRIYYTDNLYEGGAATYDSEWSSGTIEGSPILSSGITAIAASGVKDAIIANAGAYNGLSQNLDTYDVSLMNDITNDVGTYNTYTYPTIASGTAYVDTDSDGLSDAYETAQGGTTTSISATARPSTAEVTNGTIDQSGVTSYATLGYTHLDIFLADLAGDWDAIGFAADPTNFNQLKARLIRLGSGKGGAYLGSTKIKG